MPRFSTPRPISPSDNLESFDSSVAEINEWLVSRANANQLSGASATMVSLASDGNIAGFYSMSAFSIVRAAAPGRLRRGMPDPVPAILIGRLAVDQKYERQGLGASLLQHALMKALQLSESIGLRAVVVQAKDNAAAAFYNKHGFQTFEGKPLYLYVLLSDLRKALGD